MIIVNPNAGLANRMRVINSCLFLAKQNNQKRIQVLWEQNQILNATFNDLFIPINGVEIIERSFFLNYFMKYSDNKNESNSLRSSVKKNILGFFAKQYKYYNDELITPFRFNDEYWNSGHKKVILNTCEDFYTLTNETNFYHLFKPVENIKKRIDLQRQRFSQGTVGIHIRRTDNIQSVLVSKTELFLNEVEQILRLKPDTSFYLSTDAPDIEDLFKKRFGAAILTLEGKDLSRSSKQGMEDAVVDLYCLSNTRFILGSYWSSFGYVASLINNIPLKILQ